MYNIMIVKSLMNFFIPFFMISVCILPLVDGSLTFTKVKNFYFNIIYTGF